MTMEFAVVPSVDLAKLKTGDKVNFTLSGSGGTYTAIDQSGLLIAQRTERGTEERRLRLRLSIPFNEQAAYLSHRNAVAQYLPARQPPDDRLNPAMDDGAIGRMPRRFD
jgi:hypothetical protein